MKRIEQLSIFLENKLGRLYEIMEILSKVDVTIISATIADTSEYGILRIIASDPVKAYKVLKDKGIGATLSEVVVIEADSKAESFFNRLKLLSSQGIMIGYMYCFTVKEQSFIILGVGDKAKLESVIAEYSLETFNINDIIKVTK